MNSLQPEEEIVFLEVEKKYVNKRVDRFLSQQYPHFSRSTLSQLINDGSILIDGEKKKAGYRLKLNNVVSGEIFTVDESLDVVAEKIPLDIIYEDAHLLVINKKAGMVVHPGAGNKRGTLVNGLVHYYKDIRLVGDNIIRPGIVHRLDKDTSGLLIVAKDQNTHAVLADMFKKREIEKIYLAILKGSLIPEEGRLSANICRHHIQRKKMQVCGDHKGRYAITNWIVKERFQGRACLAEIKIETGRTHQIRCHMAHLGHPVLCDPVYGGNIKGFPCNRQMLHAHSLKFAHPVTQQQCHFEVEPPEDFTQCINSISLTTSG